MKKIWKVLLLTVIVVVVVLISLAFWLYRGPLTQAKIRAFSFLPFPMATVDGHFIPVSKFILRYNITQKMFGGQAGGANEQATRAAITQQLVSEKEVSIIAAEHGVSPSSRQIDAGYDAVAKQSTQGTNQSFDQMLKNYGMSSGTYKAEILEPQLLLADLQTWFYSQRSLNQGAYQTADDLVQKIQKGDNMLILAVQYSQQDADKATGGDLGLVNVTDLLPELQEAADSMKVGDVKIAASRYGLHLLRLEEKNGNQVHLRQIFLQGSGFQDWYNQQVKNFTVHKLITT